MDDDLIFRQAAIDALWEERQRLDEIMDKFLAANMMTSRALTKAERNRVENDLCIIESLPPAQSEIIRCSECSYHKEMHLPPTDTEDAVTITWCEKHRIANVKDDDFCSRWERKNG